MVVVVVDEVVAATVDSDPNLGGALSSMVWSCCGSLLHADRFCASVDRVVGG